MKHILLLEDDISLTEGLAYYLRNHGFLLDLAATIQAAVCCRHHCFLIGIFCYK